MVITTASTFSVDIVLCNIICKFSFALIIVFICLYIEPIA